MRRTLRADPKVSICLPTLNARRFLEPRMQTILAQTLADWELIVCDSFSDDGTWEYLQQFKDDPRVRLYQVPKDGLYAGWNECLCRCRGEYVYIATADDTCKPELLEMMVGALNTAETTDYRLQTEDLLGKEERRKTVDFAGTGEGHREGAKDAKNEERRLVHRSLGEGGTKNHEPDFPGLRSAVCGLQSGLPADIAVCNFDYIDEAGNIIAPPLPPAGDFYGDDRYRAQRRSGYLEFLVHVLIGTSWTTMTAVLFRRSLLEKVGLFRTDAGPLADRFWAYKSALNSDTIVVPETLATWRQHSRQGTSPSRKRSMRNLRRLWRKTIEVVEECVPLMPDAWTHDPAFLEKLLWAEKRHYYDLYRLNRTALRQRPREFLEGIGKAAALEPGFLMRRLMSGLAWERDADSAESDYLEALIRDWRMGVHDVG